VGRVDEEQEHLAVLGMRSRVADDAACLVGRDEQDVRRPMRGDELVPVLGREHRLVDVFPQERPAFADGGVEHRADRLRVVGVRQP
jgi:hypothetical protein